jgi:ABC-2 type transport system permease protein
MKLFSLAGRNFKEVYRDPVSVILGLALPVAMLILFSSIYKRVQLPFFSPGWMTPGIIIFSYAFLIMFSAVLMVKDRESSFLTRLFTAPLTSSDFILAYLLPFIPIALIQTVICLIVGAIMGASYVNIMLASVIFLLAFIICISIGMIMGTLLTMNQVTAFGSVLVTVIGLFCGAWTPLKEMGGIFETIGYALPFAHAVDASKYLLSGYSFFDIKSNFFWVLTYSIILILLAILSFKWKMKQR